MGFQTPQHKLADLLSWVKSGRLQLPDFQRGYKWDDERIRSLLVTVVLGYPLGVVMLLRTGNDQIRFKPKPLEGSGVSSDVQPALLLLDGQQRLTSFTQALTDGGVVATKDSRGKLMDRRYYIRIRTALLGPDRMDEAVVSIPGDGVVRSNFGKQIDLDLSTPEKERAAGYFPIRLLLEPFGGNQWLFAYPDPEEAQRFMQAVYQPASSYSIPAIELDESTSKGAVATVFEKVNTGGLPLNVFELLTAIFAGDRKHYDEHGTDFRLNDDWHRTRDGFLARPVLHGVENTDFLQAVTLLTTLGRALADTSGRPPAVSARREDILKLELEDYLRWVEPLREAFDWAATFLTDQYIFDMRFLPYPKQLVPLAAIRVVLGEDADLHAVRDRIRQWFWCGILGELYGGAIETRFARDVEQVPNWASDRSGAVVPRTVQDANFVESRLLSLWTRNAAAYKGIYALMLAQGTKDWLYDKAMGKVQYVDLAVDIHHIFPKKWCDANDIDVVDRESIVNKTPLSAVTNRIIGGDAPSFYLPKLEKRAGIGAAQMDVLLRTHAIDAKALRADDFDAFFEARMEAIVNLIEAATRKPVQRDLADAAESADSFDLADPGVIPDDED
jgi:hypothetical protein